MAMLKSINKYASAPAAPATLPAGALMLVEIDGKVYRVEADAVGGAGGAAIPAAPGSGTLVLTSTDGVLSWETAA